MIRLAALASAFALAGAGFACAQDMAPPPPQDPAGMPPTSDATPGARGVVASQPVANPGDSRPDTHADTGYTGTAYGAAFRDIDARIAALSAKTGGHGKAASALSAIKSEELVRRKRNGGELRDWDRELLNKRLDAVEAMVGPA